MGHPALKLSEDLCPACLLVEDSQFDQRRVTRMLKGVKPLDIMISNSIAEARKALTKASFDLMLLDNALPDGMGVDFALELRADARYGGLPILIISDFPSPFMFDKASLAKVAKTLSKSEFRPHHVRDILSRRRR